MRRLAGRRHPSGEPPWLDRVLSARGCALEELEWGLPWPMERVPAAQQAEDSRAQHSALRAKRIRT
jgi:hypothetical protein